MRKKILHLRKKLSLILIVLICIQPFSIHPYASVFEQVASRILTNYLPVLGAVVGKYIGNADLKDIKFLQPDTVEYNNSVNVINSLNDSALQKQVELEVAQSMGVVTPQIIYPDFVVPKIDFRNDLIYRSYIDPEIRSRFYSKVELEEFYRPQTAYDEWKLHIAQERAKSEILKHRREILEQIKKAQEQFVKTAKENFVTLTNYDKIYKTLVVCVNDGQVDVTARAKAIFQAHDLIEQIQDKSVKSIFEDALQAILYDLNSVDGSLDLKKPIQNSKKHLVTCLKKLSENKVVLQKLETVGSQSCNFVFNYYEHGIQKIAEQNRVMQNVCQCGQYECSAELASISKFANNKANLRFRQMLKFIEEGKLDSAKALISSFSTDSQKATAHAICKTIETKLFNEFGVLRKYENDPLYSQLTFEQKQEIKRDPKIVNALNFALIKRAETGDYALPEIKTPENTEVEQPKIPCASQPVIKDVTQNKPCEVTSRQVAVVSCLLGGMEKIKDAYFQPPKEPQKLEKELEKVPTCNNGNVPGFVGGEKENSSDSEKSQDSSEDKVTPAKEAEIDLDNLTEEEFKELVKEATSSEAHKKLKKKLSEHVEKIVNELKHNPEFADKLETLREKVKEFNESAEAKSLDVWIDCDKLVYHILHGNITNGRITGFHFTDFDCCFEFVKQGKTANGESFGKVIMKDPDLRKLIEEKPFTTIFSEDWTVEKLLDEIRAAIRDGRVVADDDYTAKNRREVLVELKNKSLLELLVDLKNGRIKSFYPKKVSK